ncbi:hypothetical protein EV424DRAFT_1430946 [Suillus variegatus]|nr:hypothetical protein EV424DRAFT_1430946 [Suillus variegatus]
MRVRKGKLLSNLVLMLPSVDVFLALALEEISADSCCHFLHNCEKQFQRPAATKRFTALASRFSFTRNLSLSAEISAEFQELPLKVTPTTNRLTGGE